MAYGRITAATVSAAGAVFDDMTNLRQVIGNVTTAGELELRDGDAAGSPLKMRIPVPVGWLFWEPPSDMVLRLETGLYLTLAGSAAGTFTFVR